MGYSDWVSGGRAGSDLSNSDLNLTKSYWLWYYYHDKSYWLWYYYHDSYSNWDLQCPSWPSSHEPIIYRASGVKLILCRHGKGRRDPSAEYSMRITFGYGDPARGQVRKLLRSHSLSGAGGAGPTAAWGPLRPCMAVHAVRAGPPTNLRGTSVSVPGLRPWAIPLWAAAPGGAAVGLGSWYNQLSRATRINSEETFPMGVIPRSGATPPRG